MSKFILLNKFIVFEKYEDLEYKETYWKCRCNLTISNVTSGHSRTIRLESRFMKSKESSIDSLIKENIKYSRFFVMYKHSGLESESIKFDFED